MFRKKHTVRNLDINISVIGLGKLGLPMAMAIAHKGHRVIGVDTAQPVLQALRQGQSHIPEPLVQEYLVEAIKNKLFMVTDDFKYAVSQSDLTFVAVNTPESGDETMDLSQLSQACRSISMALKEKKEFHTIAINSTVIPETTEHLLKPICEEASGKKTGKDFGLCVNPVWIALITVVRDFLSPPVLVIGESDQRSGDLLERFYTSLCEESIPVLRTSPLMAEIIKMAHNAFATAKMTFINEVADACTQIPGADIRVLTRFFQLGGERIGQFFQAGTGFGGPCFPRDLQFFYRYVKGLIGESPLLESIETANQHHAIRLIEQIEEELSPLRNHRIAILGLSYKPGSHIIERSFALRLIELLLAKGADVAAYDPNVKEIQMLTQEGRFYLCTTLEEAIRDADCCIIATPWEELKKIDGSFYQKGMKRPFLVDPWQIYDVHRFSQFCDPYIALGLGPTEKTPFPVT